MSFLRPHQVDEVDLDVQLDTPLDEASDASEFPDQQFTEPVWELLQRVTERRLPMPVLLDVAAALEGALISDEDALFSRAQPAAPVPGHPAIIPIEISVSGRMRSGRDGRYPCLEQVILEEADDTELIVFQRVGAHVYAEWCASEYYDDSNYQSHVAGQVFLAADQALLDAFVASRPPLAATAALIKAARLADPDGMRQAVAQGADLSPRFPRRSWWAYPVRSRNEAAVAALLALGLSPDGDGVEDPPLFQALRDPDNPCIEQLLRAGANVEARDYRGFTPFLAACLDDGLAAIPKLLAAGADQLATTPAGEDIHALLSRDGHDPVRRSEVLSLLQAWNNQRTVQQVLTEQLQVAGAAP